jgi:hypothetical protein
MSVRSCLKLAAPFVILFLAGCGGPSTSLTGQWANPDYKKKEEIDNIFVIGVAPKSEANRQMFESELSSELQSKGVNAIPSLSVMAFSDSVSKEKVEQICKEKDLDAILITRLVDTKKEENYVPSTTYVTGSPYYGSWYGYYGYGYNYGYSVSTTPGYTYTDTIVILESNLYSVKDGTLVWAGTSQTFNPNSAQDVIDPLTKLIVQSLLQNGIVVPAKK